MNETVTLLKNHDQWKQSFRREAKDLRKALGKACVSTDHIGSTAVAGIPARDEIDILLVCDLEGLGDKLGPLGYRQDRDGHWRKAGFCLWLLSKTDAKQASSFYALRDFLTGNPQAAKTYGDLKQYLASAYDFEGYQTEKAAQLQTIQVQADAQQKKNSSTARGMSLGMCLGMAVGLAVGTATGQQGTFMCIGMCVGMCLGMVLGQNQEK